MFFSLLLLLSLLIFAGFFFNTATVSLGSSDQDEDIQGGMKRKRKECSDQDKAGELNKSFQRLVSIAAVCLMFVSWNMFFRNI